MSISSSFRSENDYLWPRHGQVLPACGFWCEGGVVGFEAEVQGWGAGLEAVVMLRGVDELGVGEEGGFVPAEGLPLG